MGTCARECIVQVGAMEEGRVDLGHGRRLTGNGEGLSPGAIERRNSTGWAARESVARRVHVLGRMATGRLDKR